MKTVSKVDRTQKGWINNCEITDSGCWVWRFAKNRDGYGTLYKSIEKKAYRAHRYAYELFVGPIPHGLEIRHQCFNRACVNPAHLLPGTHRENVMDTINAGLHSYSHAKAPKPEEHRRKIAEGVRASTSILSEDDVRDIRERYAAGESSKKLREMYGVSRSTIYSITSRRGWKYVA